MTAASQKFRRQYAPVSHNYAGSDTLQNGYAMCHDVAHLAADSGYSTLSSAQQAITAGSDRESLITKPSYANLVAQDGFAGIVVNAPRGGYVGNGSSISVDILPWNELQYHNVNVYTDENVTAGDLLGPLPGFYQFGRAVVGRARFEAWDTANRSATAGLINGRFGPIDFQREQNGIITIFDHFTGDRKVAATAAAALLGDGWIMSTNGTTSTSTNLVSGSTPASAGGGELQLANATTTGAQIVGPGQPVLLTAGRSAWFRARFMALNNTNLGLFVGLAAPGGATILLAANSGLTSVVATDAIGFLIDQALNSANLTAFARKASGTGVGLTTGIPLVGATYLDVAFLARNLAAPATPTAATVDMKFWVNGTLFSLDDASALNAAQFPNTISLTPAFGIFPAASQSLTATIDRIEVRVNK